MSANFKRRLAGGFTLIELLIVVIILAILAAIAIPQFTASTSDAQLSALDANLSTMRTALEQYKIQHTGNVYPGVNAATGGTCVNGSAVTVGGAGSVDAMTAQLGSYTNAAGQACTAGDPNTFKYGPYLRQGIPAEPVSNKKDVVLGTGTPLVATAGGTGWMYNLTTGQIVSNNSNNDPSGNRKYSEH